MKSKRLGKGLEALIPQVSKEDETMHDRLLDEVGVSEVQSNPFQPRGDFDQKGLNELKQSMIERGMSVEEIERVLAATSSKEKEDK